MEQVQELDEEVDSGSMMLRKKQTLRVKKAVLLLMRARKKSLMLLRLPPRRLLAEMASRDRLPSAAALATWSR